MMERRVMSSRKAVVVSASVIRQRGTVTLSARIPELTVRELGHVQESSMILEESTVMLADILDEIRSGGNAYHIIPDAVEKLNRAEASMKRLPGSVADAMNARLYIDSLKETADFLSRSQYGGIDEREVHRRLEDLNMLHGLNPSMRKSKKGYAALGAGTLAVALLAIGAYMLSDDIADKLKDVIEDGTDFIEKQGRRFSNAIPDWIKGPVGSFMSVVGDDDSRVSHDEAKRIIREGSFNADFGDEYDGIKFDYDSREDLKDNYFKRLIRWKEHVGH